MISTEEWRSVCGFEGLYEISNLGRIRSLGRDIIRKDGPGKVFKSKILKTHPSNRLRHHKINLRDLDGNNYPRFIHRLVAEAFIPNPDNKPLVDHIDTNGENNNASNLRWVTAKENSNNPVSKNKNKTTSYKKGLELRSKIKEAFNGGEEVKLQGCMSRPKPVVKIDDLGNKVQIYPSAMEASRPMGMHKDAISKVCRKRSNSKPGGFRWRYID